MSPKQPRFKDLYENPVMKNGLPQKMIDDLKTKGWEVRRLIGDRHDVPVAFASADNPGLREIKYGTVPDGTRVIENDTTSQTIILGCGNECPILNAHYVVE